jgi:hypothetical protein
VYNELHGIDPDYQLTIPIGIDSQSAVDTRQYPIKRLKGPDISPAGSTSSESRSHLLKSSCSKSMAHPIAPTA